jgi:hypothetical protein
MGFFVLYLSFVFSKVATEQVPLLPFSLSLRAKKAFSDVEMPERTPYTEGSPFPYFFSIHSSMPCVLPLLMGINFLRFDGNVP